MADKKQDKLEKILKDNNLKVTDHRMMILSIISKNKTPTTLNHLQEKLNEIVNIDQATVYRNLNSLLDANIIRKYSHDKTKPLFEMTEGEASCTFICDNCKVFESFKMDPATKTYLKSISKKAKKMKGFEANYLEVHGICKNCK